MNDDHLHITLVLSYIILDSPPVHPQADPCLVVQLLHVNDVPFVLLTSERSVCFLILGISFTQLSVGDNKNNNVN